MGNKLAIVDARKLSPQQTTTLDKATDALIKQCRDNRQEISALVEESLTALTAGNKLSQDIAAQGKLESFWGRLSGRTEHTQGEIAAHLAEAQYAAQQTLQKLDNQNLLTVELVVAVNDKLNTQMTEVNGAINDVYATLRDFFQKAAQRLREMNQRIHNHDEQIGNHAAQLNVYDEELDALKHRAKLQDWTIGIKTRSFDGVAYKKLDDDAKIVCLARDFFELTKNFRQPNDIVYLEDAVDRLALDKQINVKNFFNRVCKDDRLYFKLFGEEARLDRFATDGTLAFALREFRGSADNKSFDFGKFARRQKADDLIATLLDELDNLARVKDLEDKDRQAKVLFLAGRIGEAVPLLEESAAAGKVQARYILATVYHEGLEVKKNPDAAQELLKANICAGDVCSIFFGKRLKLDTVADLSLDALEELADGGDVFAQYELAQHYLAANDAPAARTYLEESAKVYGLAMRQLGDIRWKNDRASAVDWYKQAYDKGIYSDKSLNRIGNCCKDAKNYVEALKWWRIGADKGYPACIANVGWAYRFGRGVEVNYIKAVEYYKRSIDAGSTNGYSEVKLGDIYWSGGCGVEKDLNVAVDWYIKAYDKGTSSDDSLVRIGFYYSQAGKYVEALKWWRIGEGKGYPACTTGVGDAYHYGWSVEVNYAKAVDYYKRSIDAGLNNGAPENNLGAIYWDGGHGIKQNRAVAVDWLKQAYAKGTFFDDSLNCIGLYYSGAGNYVEALKWRLIGADKGYPKCTANVGWAYHYGHGVEVNYATAVDYYKRSIDAGLNTGFSEVKLGNIYWSGGYGVEKDLGIAVDWYIKAYAKGTFSDVSLNCIGNYYDGAGNYVESLKWRLIGADKGYPHCTANVGWAYHYGHGVEVNYATAAEYYARAIDAGETDGYSENKLGDIYSAGGNGVKQNYEQAVKYYEAAIAKGMTSDDVMKNLANAERKLGDKYSPSSLIYYGSNTDYPAAAKWYKRAYDHGDTSVGLIKRLADVYYLHLENYREALKWYRLGEAKGSKVCMYWLGRAYMDGKGVVQNYAKALEYFARAIENNADGDAEYCIAQIYLEGGHGIEANRSTAIYWFKRAAGHDNKDSMRWLLDNLNLDFFEAMKYRLSLL